MSFLIAFVMLLRGRPIRRRAGLCHVSNSVQWLPCRSAEKWFWGGISHAAIPAICAAIFFATKWEALRNRSVDTPALLLALLWVAVGPVLIWHCECHLVPTLWREARPLFARKDEMLQFRGAALAPLSSRWKYRVITAAWVTAVMIGFLQSKLLLTQLGLDGRGDLFWYLLFMGVGVVGWYTATGICLFVKAVILVYLICGAKLKSPTFPTDGAWGLGFIGKFAFPVLGSFGTGCLFVPLLSLSIAEAGTGSVQVVVVVVVSYLVAIVVGSVMIAVSVHRKMTRVRDGSFHSWSREVVAALAVLQEGPNEVNFRRFYMYSRLIEHGQRQVVWPLSVDGALKFVVATLFFPTIAAYGGGALMEVAKLLPK